MKNYYNIYRELSRSHVDKHPRTTYGYGNHVHISDRHSSSTPGVFYTYFYNHAHRHRLEKLLNPGFLEVKQPLRNRFGSEAVKNL
jgi:hypothetical protein